MMPAGGSVLTGNETFMTRCDSDDMMYAPGVSDGAAFTVSSSGLSASPAATRGVESELTIITGPHLRCIQYAPSSESVAMHPGGDGPPPQVLGPVHPELASSLRNIGSAPSHRNLTMAGFRSLSLPSEVRAHPMERHCQPVAGAVSEGSKSKIRRPPNAFMIFANEHRKILARAFPNENNQLISVRLGCMWKSMAPDYKGIYYKMAQDAAARHKRLYPSYVYSPKEARIRKQARDQVRKDKIPKFVFYVAGSDEFIDEEGGAGGRAPGRPQPSTETRAKLLEVAQLLDSISSNGKKSQPLATETVSEAAATQQSSLEDRRLKEPLPSSQCQPQTCSGGARHEFYDLKRAEPPFPQERVGKSQTGVAVRAGAVDKHPGLLEAFTYDQQAGSALMSFQQEMEPLPVTGHHSSAYLSQRDQFPAMRFHLSPPSPTSVDLLGCEQRFPPQQSMPVLDEEPMPQPQAGMHALLWKERPLAVPQLQNRAATLLGGTAERWTAHSCPGHSAPTSHAQTCRRHAHLPLSSSALNATAPETSTFSDFLSLSCVQGAPERAGGCSAASQSSITQSVLSHEPSHRPPHGGWSAPTGVLHSCHPPRGESATAANSGHLHAPMFYGDSHGRAPCVDRLPQRAAGRPVIPAAGDAAQQPAGSSQWTADAGSAALVEDQMCPSLNSLPRAVATCSYEPLHVPRYTAPAWCDPPGVYQVSGTHSHTNTRGTAGPGLELSARQSRVAASPQPRLPLTIPSVLGRSEWMGDGGRAPTPPGYSRPSGGVLWPSPVSYLRASCSPNIEDLIGSPDQESPTL